MTYLVTVNYNNSKDTKELLESLEIVKTEFRIIVVDNYSNEDDYNSLKRYLEDKGSIICESLDHEDIMFEGNSKFLLLRNSKNLGFAGGNNVAIRIAQKQADFEAVALINNDTVVDPGFLDEILRFRRENIRADIIGCRIFYDTPNEVIWYDGGKYFRHTTRAVHINENRRISDIRIDDSPRRTEFITGCFMYISKHCIDTIGLLDESLFMYDEDLEYCIRAIEKGLRLYCVPKAVIWHKLSFRTGSNSSCYPAYMGARNRFLISRKHSNVCDRAITIIFYIFSRFPRFLLWSIKGRTDLARAQVKGMIDGLTKSII